MEVLESGIENGFPTPFVLSLSKHEPFDNIPSTGSGRTGYVKISLSTWQ